MNFIILGAGAIGCYIGGRLAAGGRRVTLVGRPATIESIARGGLTLSDLDGFNAHVPARRLRLATSLAAVSMVTPSVVLLCVKGGATEAAALELAICCPAGTTVVSLQNGIDNLARIAAIAPRVQALAGTVACRVVTPRPGHVHRATAGGLFMARCSATQEIALLLNACGLATRLTDDMRPVQWGKLLLDLHSPTSASADLPLRARLVDRDYRRVLAGLQREALAVLNKAGIKPARVGGAPPQLLPYILRLPDWLFRLVAARMLRVDHSARCSMWDDLPTGHIVEIADLCGAVVRLATRHGIAAPRNAAMYQLAAGQGQGPRQNGPEVRKTALP